MNTTTKEQGINSREKIIRFLKAFMKENGYSPTVREICQGVGLSSSSTVYKHLEILKDKGIITWNPSIARTIRFVSIK